MGEKELVSKLAIIFECSEKRVMNIPYVEAIEKLVNKVESLEKLSDQVDSLKKFIDGELDERNRKVRDLRNIIKEKQSVIEHLLEVEIEL